MNGLRNGRKFLNIIIGVVIGYLSLCTRFEMSGNQILNSYRDDDMKFCYLDENGTGNEEKSLYRGFVYGSMAN